MTPTFPYPLTPEVRADLWRFFGDDPEEMMPGLPALPNGTWARPKGKNASAPNALLDTPFARAFVAWREARENALTERSCFNCAEYRRDEVGHVSCAPIDAEDGNGPCGKYAADAGCYDTDDGMPKDRTIKCPGWKVKP